MILNIANFFRAFARFGTILLGFTMISIAIFTGAIKYGITIENILRNLPNALPWFLLLLTLLLAWEYELLGGIVMILLGLGGIYYLQSSLHTSQTEIYLMWAIILFAVSFILSWAIRQMYELSFT